MFGITCYTNNDSQIEFQEVGFKETQKTVPGLNVLQILYSRKFLL